jgi:ribosome-associated heat shock protein Hsp15
MRIDKYLWCVRLFKTRSIATEQVRTGKVKIKSEVVKPARELKVGEVVELKRGPVVFSYQVVQFPKARLGAKLVGDYMLDVTADEEKKKWVVLQEHLTQTRDRGTGRPTKKDRREMDAFYDDLTLDEWDLA